jgi:protein-disulfide isomerase
MLSGPAPALQTGDRVDVPVFNTDPVHGPANAPVTLIELTDYQCPYCRAAVPALRVILAQNPGRIRFIHKDFPLDIHDMAFKAAEAARCAGEQGRFWEMRGALMAPRQELSDEIFEVVGASLHLDVRALSTCIGSRKYEGRIMDDVKQFMGLGFRATPSFVVNGQVVVGFSPEVLDKAVKDALANFP